MSITLSYDKNGIPHYGRDKKYPYSEDKLQIASAKLLKYYPSIYGIHPPNERGAMTYKGVIYKLQAMGAVWGASDWFLFTPATGFVELKADGGSLTKNEVTFLTHMQSLGFPIAVCWNLEAAEHIFSKHAKGENWTDGTQS